LNSFFLSQVTHGFPQNPSPLFRSIKFNIENRPGIEDQRVEQVVLALAKLDAPNIDSKSLKRDTRKTIELARWLSDWHLIVFLGTTQLLSPVSEATLFNALFSLNLYMIGRYESSHAYRVIATSIGGSHRTESSVRYRRLADAHDIHSRKYVFAVIL
jgi:hypothetical protein